MAAFAFLGPIRAGFTAAAPARLAEREIVFSDAGFRIPEREHPVARWQRGADGRLICRWAVARS
jgi:hypothetical protein